MKTMKTMKHFLSMAALALMGAMMTGCSNDDNIDNAQPESKSKLETLTTTISLGEDGTTRALTPGGVKTFAVGEQIAVVYSDTDNKIQKATSTALTTTDISNEGKTATFTVTVEDPDKTQNVVYVYPASMINDDGTVNVAALATQDGTFDTLESSLDFAIGADYWNGEELPSLDLENQLAILAITLKDADGTNDITSTITGMTLSYGTSTCTVTREAAAGPIYVAITPLNNLNVKITATDGSKYYNKNLTGKTYAASNGYSVSWMMPEALLSAATTADYGMAVCAAGHLHLAKTAVPSGCTAVGILGKVTETGHGLILSLQDAPSQSWNTINSWTSVTTYAGTTLQQLPAGVLGSLTSYTTLGSTTVSNWCVGQKSDYEAIFQNLGSTVHDQDGYTYDGNVNAYITTGVGGTPILSDASGLYWSATDLGFGAGWLFNSNCWDGDFNDSYYILRPVLGF